jgi:hypothetical protein
MRFDRRTPKEREEASEWWYGYLSAMAALFCYFFAGMFLVAAIMDEPTLRIWDRMMFGLLGVVLFFVGRYLWINQDTWDRD